MSDVHERLRKLYEALAHVDLLGGSGGVSAYIELNPYQYESRSEDRYRGQALGREPRLTKRWVAHVGNLIAEGDTAEAAVDDLCSQAHERIKASVAEHLARIAKAHERIKYIEEFDAHAR